MYPTISEYLEAIKSAEDNFEQLKHLRPVLEDDGSPIMTSGNFAVVFKMKDEQTGKLHAVKCFRREQEGRAEAYRQIAEELEYVSSTFLTPIKYLDKELFVDSSNSEDSEFPVLLMDWVEGQTLDKYIREHIDDQYELSLIAYQFSRLAMWLMPQPFAHGDLKPDNILVKSNGTLVLVDYDGMYVPAMKGQKARELGSPDFRHPSRTETDFDEHIDDFSLASILLSLKAISLQPSLLEEYGASDRLLFSEKDYRNLSESKALDAIKDLMHDAELASLYSLFILAASQNNLTGVSFRLFYLNRPSVSSPKKSMRVLQINKKIVNQSNQKIIKKELLASFQGKKNVWHILLSNGTSSYLTQDWSFNYEASAKGACKLNTVENDKKHVLFLFNDRDAEVGRYYIGEKLRGLTPKQLTEIKHELCFFEAWNPETNKWVPCVGKSKESVKKQKQENEDLRTEVTDEDLTNAWTDEFGVKYSKDRKRLLKVSKNLSRYSILEGTKVICKGSFYGITALNSINIPNSVIIIGGGAFQSCESLTSISIPDSVVTIEGGAFYGCFSLSSIGISDSVKEIGPNAFCGCPFVSFHIPNCFSIVSDGLFNGCCKLKSITIPDGVRSIGKDAFSGCKEINSINLPEGVVSIGNDSFCGCTSLTTIDIPGSVTEIGDGAFRSCTSLTSINIPQSVTTIGEYAFSGCTALATIHIPESVTKIGKNAFSCFTGIKTIIIPIGTRKQFIKFFPKYEYKLVEQEMGWTVKETRPFNAEEIAMVSRAEVVPSQYGNSVCFFMRSGGQTYIPLSKQSKLTVGEELDMKTAKLMTLCRMGHGDITRVIE